MHARCGRGVSSWNNTLLYTLKQLRQPHNTLQLYQQMQQEGTPADSKTFVIALQACCKLLDMEDGVCSDGLCMKEICFSIGIALHADARRKGFVSHVFVDSALLTMYGKCGNIAEAENVFEHMCGADVVSWTALLALYTEHGRGLMGLQMFRKMLEDGIAPNARTFLVALQACCTLLEMEEDNQAYGRSIKAFALDIGAALHEDALRSGFVDVYIGSALVSMYSKYGKLDEAEQVFSQIPHRDIVFWNAMLFAYVEQREETKALHLYKTMQREVGLMPTYVTFVGALQACCVLAEKEPVTLFQAQSSRLKSLEIGKALHLDAKLHNLASHIFVASALVRMYGKCGSIAEAETVFHGLSVRNLVTWNAVLSAYLDQDEGHKVLSLYQWMRNEGVNVNNITCSCILGACSETGSVEVCRQMHCAIITECDMCVPLATSLTHAYGSCGASMEDAHSVFDSLCNPDIIMWNALSDGYAREGNYKACLQAFEEMQQTKVRPTDVSFLSLLSVCNHSGLVDEGIDLFNHISKLGALTANAKHCAVMVDLLGRSGDFKKIEYMLFRLEVHPDLAGWQCLLRACQTHGNVPLGKYAFDKVTLVQGQEAYAYVLMSNIYANAGLWNDACQLEISFGQMEGACE